MMILDGFMKHFSVRARNIFH